MLLLEGYYCHIFDRHTSTRLLVRIKLHCQYAGNSLSVRILHKGHCFAEGETDVVAAISLSHTCTLRPRSSNPIPLVKYPCRSSIDEENTVRNCRMRE